MSSQEGFLASEMLSNIENIRADLGPWFDAIRVINNLGMRVLPNVKVIHSSNQQLVAATLYGRVLTSFQAITVLAERGLTADAITVLRGGTETAILLEAVIQDQSVCSLLVDRYLWHRRKLMNAWLNDPEAVKQMTREEANAIRANIAAIEGEHPQVRALDGDPINLATLAQKANRVPLYNAVYRFATGDAAHTSVAVLNRHVRADDDGNVIGLKFGPDAVDLPATLSGAISMLSHAIHSVLCYFNLPQFTDELDLCVAKWKRLSGSTTDR